MRPLFSLLLFLLPISLLAQYQVRSATLTDHNEKTISGFVKYYDWDKNPKSIEFGEDSSGSMNSFPLRNIRKLSIKDGSIYESLYLKVPYYFKNPIKLGQSIVQRIDSTYYFAELLLDSEAVKLYRFFDDDKQLRFVVSKYDSLVILENIHARVVKNEKTYDFGDPVFRKTLRTVLVECPTLNTDNTLFTESSLISLLKQYLSFCRIDSRIYLEQKEVGKYLVGLGAFGSYLSTSEGNAQIYGVTIQVLLPQRFHNLFVMMDVAKVVSEKGFDLGLYGGTFFGRRAIQGKLYTGVSTFFGAFDTGIGLSYRKTVSVEMRYPVFIAIFNGFPGIPPLINLRAVFPLSSLVRK